MSNPSNQSGETLRVAVVLAMAAIVGVLIIVQLLRVKPVDLSASLIIAVCFVVAVVATAMWGKRSEN